MSQDNVRRIAGHPCLGHTLRAPRSFPSILEIFGGRYVPELEAKHLHLR